MAETLGFQRDRLTWAAYVLIAWFALLQAATGLVVAHLRSELGLSFSVGGLHVAGFAAGSIIAGVVAARLERGLGRRRLLWSAAVVMGAGTIALTMGRAAPVTIGAALVMGLGGALLLVTAQAALSDRHGELRPVALAEANVAASIAYVALIGALSLATALNAGWRVPLLASLAIPLVTWVVLRRLEIDAPLPSARHRGRLPVAFWIAAAMLLCTTAAEWCVTAWGATFIQVSTHVSADAAVALMGAYFGGVLVGRVLGSRLARRYSPRRLLLLALAVSAGGFGVLWTSSAQPQALVGLLVIGIGLGNLFPMALSLAVALAPERAALANGRAVTMSAFAVLLAPLTVGALADATSLQAALTVVPVLLALAAVGVLLAGRASGGRPAPAHESTVSGDP